MKKHVKRLLIFLAVLAVSILILIFAVSRPPTIVTPTAPGMPSAPMPAPSQGLDPVALIGAVGGLVGSIGAVVSGTAAIIAARRK